MVPPSLCQNQKKNTIDPENIIASYGADAARLFILSDSPPEKDVQWSEEGIISSFKFIQKFWNLNNKILNEIKKNHIADSDNEIEKYTNKFIKNVTDNLENFSYNKIVANLHEVHTFLSRHVDKGYSSKTLTDNYQKILITMMPVIPHFTSECLYLLNKKIENKWPSYDEKYLEEDNIQIVVQINGKKRGLIKTKKNISEIEILKKIENDLQLKKYIGDKKINKKIYVPNKIINIII